METKIQQAFSALDGIDDDMDDLKSRESKEFAKLEAQGVSKQVAMLVRKLCALTEKERRAFDAAMELWA